MQNSQPDDYSDNKQVSLYGNGQVSAEVFADGCIKLKAAFPKLPNSWYELLDEMIDEERFTNQRFVDAVKELIKNCEYPEPTIAKFLGHDKIIDSYSYDEILDKHNKQVLKMGNYISIDTGLNKPRYVLKEYQSKYNLPLWAKN